MPLSREAIEQLKAIQKDSRGEPIEISRLTPEDVREFQALVAHATGVQLSTQEAWNRAIELIALVRMLVRPYPEDEEDGVQTSSDLPS